MSLLLFTCFHKAVKCSLTTEHLKGTGSDRVPVYKLAAEFDKSWTPTCAPYNAREHHNMFPLVAPHTTGIMWTQQQQGERGLVLVYDTLTACIPPVGVLHLFSIGSEERNTAISFYRHQDQDIKQSLSLEGKDGGCLLRTLLDRIHWAQCLFGPEAVQRNWIKYSVIFHRWRRRQLPITSAL